jgi:asparagine synthase (glutamine-hydrolysing)
VSGLCGAYLRRQDAGGAWRATVERMTTALAHRSKTPPRVLELEGAVICSVGAEVATGEGGVAAVLDGIVLEGAGGGGPAPNGAAAEVADRWRSTGEGLLEQLRGEFALALWDGRARRGLLARDPFGIRPLYVANCPGAVLFASELKAILASGLVEPRLDYAAIDVYLDLGFGVSPRSPIAGVRRLRPGHAVTIVDGRSSGQRAYWRFPEPVDAHEPAEVVEERMHEVLADSVRRQVRASSAPAVLLSAGIDSAIVLALAARERDGLPPAALTAAFSGVASAYEVEPASRIAGGLGAPHRAVLLAADDDALPLAELAWLLDEPTADLSALGMSAVARACSSDVDVALSGLFADVLFAADSASRRLELIAPLDRLPRAAKSAASRLAGVYGGRPARMARVLEADGAGERYRVQWALEDADRRRLVRGELAELAGDSTRALLEELAAGVRSDPVTSYSYVDLQLCGDYALVADRAAAAGPIEIRFPYADVHVVEAAARIPAALRVRRGTTKLVLRRLAGRLLPADRPEPLKAGFFDAATAAWVRRQLAHGGSDLLLDRAAGTAAFVDRAALEHEVRGALAGGPVSLVFKLLMLEAWLTLYLPRAVAAGGRTGPEPGGRPAGQHAGS